MTRIWKRALAALTGLTLLLTGVAAATEAGLEELTRESAAYVSGAVDAPAVGAQGGEWAVLGLARSGAAAPEGYFQDYLARVEEEVAEKQGVLHEVKYTEYSRLIVCLSALGRDARDVGGYDLTAPLGDFDKTVWQGVNGPAWALLALDSADYPVPRAPEGAVQATRQMYIDHLLDLRQPDGGWALTAGASEADVTGMVLQALAKYTGQSAVAQAVEEALDCMSAQQESDGGFGSWGNGSAESTVQMLVALGELGLSLEDEQFVKEGNTILDALLSYRRDDGSFAHTEDGTADLMASEQGLYGLAAALRAQSGQPSLYRMTDALALPDAERREEGSGLPGKHEAVNTPPVTLPDMDFADIAALPEADAVRALARRGVLTGYDDGLFHGEDSLTRAQFSTMVVRALGLEGQVTAAFTDVAAEDWFAPYVGAAHAYGIVNGTGDGSAFTPGGSITRQEAAVMVARAAALCGMDTALDDTATRNILAGQFVDYVQAGQWARPALAFCCREGILSVADLELRPTETVTRAEVAGMLHTLLDRAELL